jgi:cytochrome b561
MRMATIARPLTRRSAPQTSARYDGVARALHWLVFALVGVQFLIGWTMPEIHRDTPQQGLVDWHISMGVTLMVVVAVRLFWRLTHPVPLATSMKAWERKLAKVAHGLLYLLLLVTPALGWVAAGYFGYTVHLFGLFTLPALADNTMDWAHELGDVHAVLSNVLIGVVALHVLGALYHYFIVRDGVMQRILPG